MYFSKNANTFNYIRAFLDYDEKQAATFELIRTISALFLGAIESIYANDKERIDIVIYLNGFAIITIELKCNFAGQSADNAIYQYRMERDSKSRLFLFKEGVLVNFTMDLHEVYMTTMLDKDTITMRILSVLSLNITLLLCYQTR